MSDRHTLLVTDPFLVSFRERPRNLVHRHNFFEPCLVLSGQGEFEHADERFDLATGDLFLADQGTYHEIRSMHTRDLDIAFTRFLILRTDVDDPRTSIDDAIIRDFLNRHRSHAPDRAELGTLFDVAFQSAAASESHRDRYLLQETMRLLVLKLMSELTIETDSSREHRVSLHLHRALAAIDASLHAQIRIASVAQSVGLSERSLRRLFRDQLGRTVVEEIRHRRMQRAASLLAMPELSITEVGRRVGIPDPSRFSRSFRSVMGESPRQFRAARMDSPWGWTDSRTEPMRTEVLERGSPL